MDFDNITEVHDISNLKSYKIIIQVDDKHENTKENMLTFIDLIQ